MGSRGPQKNPTKLEVLRGNPGKRQLNKDEPEFEKEEQVPAPPPYLSTYAKKEWKRLAPMVFEIGLLTKGDYSAFAAYCQNYHRWVEAEKGIRKRGTLTTIDENGKEAVIQEVKIANEAMKLMLKFAKEFGLTPASRTGVVAEKSVESENPFAKFLSRTSGT